MGKQLGRQCAVEIVTGTAVMDCCWNKNVIANNMISLCVSFSFIYLHSGPVYLHMARFTYIWLVLCTLCSSNHVGPVCPHMPNLLVSISSPNNLDCANAVTIHTDMRKWHLLRVINMCVKHYTNAYSQYSYTEVRFRPCVDTFTLIKSTECESTKSLMFPSDHCRKNTNFDIELATAVRFPKNVTISHKRSRFLDKMSKLLLRNSFVSKSPLHIYGSC